MLFECVCVCMFINMHAVLASHILRYIKGLFETADRNNDGTLDFSEIIKLMKQLNVGLSKRVLKKKFKVCLFVCLCVCVRACMLQVRYPNTTGISQLEAVMYGSKSIGV